MTISNLYTSNFKKMKLFIKKIIIYACFIFFITLLIQSLISFRIKGKTISENDNLEQTSNINVDLVFLGSSRCSMHFDPYFFNTNFKIKSTNLGVNGHSEIAMATLRLKYYLSRNKPPKFAILNFDPFAVATSINNLTLKNEFARYAFFPSENELPLMDYFKFNPSERYIPLYSLFKYKQLRNCVLMKNINGYTKYGYQMNSDYLDTISDSGIMTPKKHYFKENQMTPITNSLSQLNQLCAKNNIKLLCIQTPVHNIIYDKEVFSNTKKICSKLNIPFIDVSKESIKNNARYFCNSNHLNKYGVEKMNQFLKNNSQLTTFFND